MPQLRALEYGVPTDKAGITVRLGIEKGFFADEGLDLSMRTVFGGPPLAAAYDRGELHVGEIGSPPAITAMSRGARFKIVGGAMRRKAHLYLGVRSDIPDFRALRGKRLGLLSRGSCDEWFGRAIFLREGLDPDADIEWVPLGGDYAHIIPLMKQGAIDACVVSEPNVSTGECDGTLRVWAAAYEEPYLPEFQWIVLVARDDFIRSDGDTIRALLRGYERSARYAVEHIDEWAALYCRCWALEPDTARHAIARELPHVRVDCQIDMAGLRKVIELQQRLGAVTTPLAVESIVDLRFLPAALERSPLAAAGAGTTAL
jgi:ABC-type nitrate/sulfonate/bicarbonate transport system substrate-binding protein